MSTSTTPDTPGPDLVKYECPKVGNTNSSEFTDISQIMRNMKGSTTRQAYHWDTTCSKSSSVGDNNVARPLAQDVQPYICIETVCGRRFWSEDKQLDHAWEDFPTVRSSSGSFDYTRISSHSSCTSGPASPLSRAPSLASSISTLKSDQLSTRISLRRRPQIFQSSLLQNSSFPSHLPSQLSASNTSDHSWGAVDSLRHLPEQRYEQDGERSYCGSSISSDSLDSASSVPLSSEASSSSLSSSDDTLPPDQETVRYNLEMNLIGESLTANDYPQGPSESNSSTKFSPDDASASEFIYTQETFRETVKPLPFNETEITRDLAGINQRPPESFVSDDKSPNLAGHVLDTGAKITSATRNVNRDEDNAMIAIPESSPWLERDFEADHLCYPEMVFDKGVTVSRGKYSKRASLTRKVALAPCEERSSAHFTVIPCLSSGMSYIPSPRGAQSSGQTSFMASCPQSSPLDGPQRYTPHRTELPIQSESSNSTSPVSTPSMSNSKFHKFFCTSCDLKFCRKGDWKRHERAFHEPEKRWQCPDCNAYFNVETRFTHHHRKNHSCKKCDHANEAKMELPRKVAWGCGFCCRADVSLTSWELRCDHIAAHFKAGQVKDDWRFTNVVLGLLKLSTAWKSYVTELHGRHRRKWPSFSWEATKGPCSELLRDLEYGQCAEEGSRSLMQKIYDLGIQEHSTEGMGGLYPNDSESVTDADDWNDTYQDEPIRNDAHSALRNTCGSVQNLSNISEEESDDQESDDEESDDEDYISDDEDHDQLNLFGIPLSDNHDKVLKPILSHEKQQIIDRVMDDLQHMLPGSPTNRSHAGSEGSTGSTGSTGSNEGRPAEKGSNTGSQARPSTRKRGLDGSNRPPGDGNDDDGEPSKRRKVKDPSDHSLGKNHKFACPFFKRNPEKYKRYRSCPGPGWDTVHRLKQHIYSRHMQPIQCVRCWDSFKTTEEHEEHQRATQACQIKSKAIADGCDRDQEKRLRSKKRSAAVKSESDKWKQVWKILFPRDADDQIPTPFYNTPSRDDQPTAKSPGSDDFAGFEEYRRRELPRIIRQRVEEAVQREHEPLEERVKNEMMQMIRDCTTELLREYRKSVACTPACGADEELFFKPPSPIPVSQSGPGLLETSRNTNSAYIAHSTQLSDSGYRSLGSGFTTANTSYSAASRYQDSSKRSDQRFTSASLYRTGPEIVEERQPVVETPATAAAAAEASQIVGRTLSNIGTSGTSYQNPVSRYVAHPTEFQTLVSYPMSSSSIITPAIEETGSGFSGYHYYPAPVDLPAHENLLNPDSIEHWGFQRPQMRPFDFEESRFLSTEGQNLEATSVSMGLQVDPVTAGNLVFYDNMPSMQGLNFEQRLNMDSTDNNDLQPAG